MILVYSACMVETLRTICNSAAVPNRGNDHLQTPVPSLELLRQAGYPIMRMKTTLDATAVRNLRRPVLFGLVGVANTAVDMGIYWSATRMAHITPLLANVLGILAGSLHSYIANGKLTFRDTNTQLRSLKTQLSFLVSMGVCLAVSSATMFVLLKITSDLAAKILTTLATFIANYTLSRRFVYSN